MIHLLYSSLDKIEQKNAAILKKDDTPQKIKIDEESEIRLMKQQAIVDQQHMDIQVRTK